MKTFANRKEHAERDPAPPQQKPGPNGQALPAAIGPAMPSAVGGGAEFGSRKQGEGATGQQEVTIPAALLGRARRVLGMDLSDVTVVIDPSLEKQGKNGVAEGGKIIRLAPKAANSRRVIWHEMTHIMQQRGGNAHGKPARSDKQSLEEEAHAGAEAGQADEEMEVGPAGTSEPLYDADNSSGPDSGDPVESTSADTATALQEGAIAGASRVDGPKYEPNPFSSPGSEALVGDIVGAGTHGTTAGGDIDLETYDQLATGVEVELEEAETARMKALLADLDMELANATHDEEKQLINREYEALMESHTTAWTAHRGRYDAMLEMHTEMRDDSDEHQTTLLTSQIQELSEFDILPPEQRKDKANGGKRWKAEYQRKLENRKVTFDSTDLEIAHNIVHMEDSYVTAYLTGRNVPMEGSYDQLTTAVRERVSQQFSTMNSELAMADLEISNIEIVAKDKIHGARDFDYQGGLFFRNKFFKGATSRRPLTGSQKDLEKQLKKALNFSALPNLSRHNWHTDIDFERTDGAAWKKGGLEELDDWLRLHAAEFGFVKSYTHGRSGGHSFEPWHYSYVPIALALQEAYQERFDDLLPTLTEQLMEYCQRKHAGKYDPEFLNKQSLYDALVAVDIKSYLTSVSNKAP